MAHLPRKLCNTLLTTSLVLAGSASALSSDPLAQTTLTPKESQRSWGTAILSSDANLVRKKRASKRASLKLLPDRFSMDAAAFALGKTHITLAEKSPAKVKLLLREGDELGHITLPPGVSVVKKKLSHDNGYSLKFSAKKRYIAGRRTVEIQINHPSGQRKPSLTLELVQNEPDIDKYNRHNPSQQYFLTSTRLFLTKGIPRDVYLYFRQPLEIEKIILAPDSGVSIAKTKENYKQTVNASDHQYYFGYKNLPHYRYKLTFSTDKASPISQTIGVKVKVKMADGVRKSLALEIERPDESGAAPPTDVPLRFINVKHDLPVLNSSSKCLQIFNNHGFDDGIPALTLYSGSCDGSRSPAQSWVWNQDRSISPTDERYSGQCLAINAPTHQTGADKRYLVSLQPCNSTDNKQQWVYTDKRIQSQWDPDYALTDGATFVYAAREDSIRGKPARWNWQSLEHFE